MSIAVLVQSHGCFSQTKLSMDWLLHPCIVLAPPFRPDGVDGSYGKLLKVPQPSLGTNLLSEKLRIFNTYIISSSNYDGSKSNMNETSHMIMIINKNN